MELNAADFIFHSDLVPLSFPFKTATSINTGTSLTAGQTRTTVGPWFDTGPGKLGVNAFITYNGKTAPDFMQEEQLRPGNAWPHLTAFVEKDSTNRVRLVVRETNPDSVTHTYTQRPVSVDFYMVHIV